MKKKVLTCILTTVCISFALIPQQVDAASWKHNNTGWWYQEDNGTYAKQDGRKSMETGTISNLMALCWAEDGIKLVVTGIICTNQESWLPILGLAMIL